jgi:hypothetical protein
MHCGMSSSKFRNCNQESVRMTHSGTAKLARVRRSSLGYGVALLGCMVLSTWGCGVVYLIVQVVACCYRQARSRNSARQQGRYWWKSGEPLQMMMDASIIIYLSRVLCLSVCDGVCVSQFVSERSAILLVLLIKLTKETRGRVWIGRD